MLLAVHTPPLPARKFFAKINSHTDLGLPSRNYRHVTQAEHPREVPFVHHTLCCHWEGKKFIIKGCSKGSISENVSAVHVILSGSG